MKFNELKFVTRDIGRQAKVEFPNGYGASVVQGPFSYGGDEGKYELAVFHDGEICYNSGITEDVLGWLTEDEVTDYLQQIENLSEKGVGQCQHQRSKHHGNV